MEQGSLWQSPAWKAYQKALGRKTRMYDHTLVIIDTTLGGLSTWEIPRGAISDDILADARKEKALYVCVSPTHMYPEATRTINLTMKDDALLNQMKPKGRYNIRLAQRHGIDVRESTDVEAFHALMKRTGERDRFGILPLAHYKKFLEHMPGAFLLLAYHPQTSDTEPVAGLIGMMWADTGIYYYGASDERHRALMAPYLLQWEAMKHCQRHGCAKYDLLGIAPPDASPNHPWAGITAFKEKFGGEVLLYPPEQMVVLRPVVWSLLQWKRKILG